MEENDVNISQLVLYEVPFEKHKKKFLDLPPEEVLNPNIDIDVLVSGIFGALRNLEPYAPILINSQHFDPTDYTNLEEYNMALSYAQSMCRMFKKPDLNIQKWVADANKTREGFRTDVAALAVHGLIDAEETKEFNEPSGYKSIAAGLQGYALFLLRNWDKISSKCAIARDDLIRAQQVASYIQREVGIREKGIASLGETTDIRNRAFTVTINAYNETRSVIEFARRKQNDAALIVPSLYAGRGRAKSQVEEVAPPVPVAVQPNPVVKTDSPRTLPFGSQGGSPFES